MALVGNSELRNRMDPMIYAIMLCIANVGCHALGEPVYTYTFDSPQACLAKLPVVMVRGKSVQADGRLYVNNVEWLECDGKQTWQTVTPAAAVPAKPTEPRTYTVAICTAKGCTQAMPVVHETDDGCRTKLFKNALDNPDKLDLDAGEARVYMHGKSRDAWIQCYDTRQ
jgi:hypothetical protein